MTRLPAVALAALLLGASPGVQAQTFSLPKVDVEFDPEFDFQAAKTYAWGEIDAPARNPSHHVNIRWHVERGLEQKGLRRAAEGTEPDVEVRYAVRSERKLRSTASSSTTSQAGSASDVRTSVSFDRVDEGVFSLQLLVPGSSKTVWHAETDFRIPDSKKVEQETRGAVARLLSKYPPPKAAPKPAP